MISVRPFYSRRTTRALSMPSVGASSPWTKGGSCAMISKVNTYSNFYVILAQLQTGFALRRRRIRPQRIRLSRRGAHHVHHALRRCRYHDWFGSALGYAHASHGESGCDSLLRGRSTGTGSARYATFALCAPRGSAGDVREPRAGTRGFPRAAQE